jgi:hypothetical protein
MSFQKVKLGYCTKLKSAEQAELKYWVDFLLAEIQSWITDAETRCVSAIDEMTQYVILQNIMSSDFWSSELWVSLYRE